MLVNRFICPDVTDAVTAHEDNFVVLHNGDGQTGHRPVLHALFNERVQFVWLVVIRMGTQCSGCSERNQKYGAPEESRH